MSGFPHDGTAAGQEFPSEPSWCISGGSQLTAGNTVDQLMAIEVAFSQPCLYDHQNKALHTVL